MELQLYLHESSLVLWDEFLKYCLHLQVTTLENGLKVASLETHSPKSHLGLFIDAASRHETPSTLGITHALRNAAFLVCI